MSMRLCVIFKTNENKMSFDDALAIAQQLGYAEKDPTADVEGHDTCRKICILAALAFGKHVYPESVYTEGITKVTSADTAYADFAGCVIKLIGRAKLNETKDKCSVAVYPAFVDRKNQLSHVEDVFNAIENAVRTSSSDSGVLLHLFLSVHTRA